MMGGHGVARTLRLAVFGGAALIAYRYGGGAEPAARLPSPAADSSDAQLSRSASCTTRVLAFRFVDRGAASRVTGTIERVDAASIRIEPVQLPAEAVRANVHPAVVDFTTSSTEAVGFDVAVDSDEPELSWAFELGEQGPWSTYVGPFGLSSPERVRGATVRELCERMGLADVLPTADRGLFIGCTCR
jgi:hypothetical protein